MLRGVGRGDAMEIPDESDDYLNPLQHDCEPAAAPLEPLEDRTRAEHHI